MVRGLVLVLTVTLLAACGGERRDDAGAGGTAGFAPSGGAAGTTTTGGNAGLGGAAGAGGFGATGGTGASAGTGGGAGCAPAPKSLAPGEPLTSGTDTGGGACAGVTVDAFLAKIHAAHPELADIKLIFKPDLMSDGSFVYPYRKPDGGFAFVLKRGGGDCPAGCTENEYWYFDSGAGCSPVDAGHFKPSWGSGGCVNVVGEAKWGKPPPTDPAQVCDADLSPQPISGTHQLWACGTFVPCSLSKPAGETFAKLVTFEIVQDASDPSKGTVTLSGTGYAKIDKLPLPATFLRKRFEVSFFEDNLPATCPKSLGANVAYDFEGFGASQLVVDELDTPDCSNAPDQYCKGGISAKLFAGPP